MEKSIDMVRLCPALAVLTDHVSFRKVLSGHRRVCPAVIRLAAPNMNRTRPTDVQQIQTLSSSPTAAVVLNPIDVSAS
jgi:hypothetical protein